MRRKEINPDKVLAWVIVIELFLGILTIMILT